MEKQQTFNPEINFQAKQEDRQPYHQVRPLASPYKPPSRDISMEQHSSRGHSQERYPSIPVQKQAMPEHVEKREVSRDVSMERSIPQHPVQAV